MITGVKTSPEHKSADQPNQAFSKKEVRYFFATVFIFATTEAAARQPLLCWGAYFKVPTSILCKNKPSIL